MDDIKEVKTFKPDSTPLAAAAPKAVSAAKRQYVGPDYKFGIIIPGTNEQIQPRDYNDEQIAALIARWPDAAKLWS